MPGSSLWLLPPPSHPLFPILTSLVSSTLPSKFPNLTSSPRLPRPQYFSPHMTLTSEISPSVYLTSTTTTTQGDGDSDNNNNNNNNGAQRWLDSIPFPPGQTVKVRFRRIQSQDIFYRRCFVSVDYDDDDDDDDDDEAGDGGGVRNIVATAREYGVEGVGEKEKVKEWLDWWKKEYGPHVSLMYGDEPISDEVMKEIERTVIDAGVKLPEVDNDKGEWAGWEGGVVWLVPTDGPIEDWKPIATREL